MDTTSLGDTTEGQLASGTPLESNFWYDARGNLIKASGPGGLVEKNAYDALGRVFKTYWSDGGGDTAYGNADDVTGDYVLEQVEYGYDNNDNLILTTYKRHYHDDTVFGELGDDDATPYARVSYSANYYDLADRLTGVADVGTNPVSTEPTVYSRPGSVPSRSDAVLVTEYAYDDAGFLKDVTDPRGITARSTYDRLWRAIQVDEAQGTGGERTTEYRYDLPVRPTASCGPWYAGSRVTDPGGQCHGEAGRAGPR